MIWHVLVEIEWNWVCDEMLSKMLWFENQDFLVGAWREDCWVLHIPILRLFKKLKFNWTDSMIDISIKHFTSNESLGTMQLS